MSKDKARRNPVFYDEKYTGGEPTWPANSKDWPDDKFDSHLRKSFHYYNYYYTQKELKKYVIDWMRQSKKYSAADIKAFDRSGDKRIPITVCSLVMSVRAGMTLRPRHIEYMTSAIAEAIQRAEPEEVEVVGAEVKPEAYKPTIQERLAEKTSETIGELEGQLDFVVQGIKRAFKPYDFLVNNKVPTNQLGKFEEVFLKHKTELEAAQAKKDRQLTEAYGHYKATDFKKMLAWLDDMLTAIDQYRGVKKATKKARVKKAPSREKLVAKLKYARELKELKLVSINPAEIIGAAELWIYNAKTRKLGKYVAAAHNQLTVKGTSIENFDTDRSVCKTIRKPEEKLKEFMKAGKVQLRKFLEEIKATEVRMNGRINSDTVLLRVS